MKDHPSQWITSGVTCRDVAVRASEYLDDRLPILTQLRIALHLGSCARCRTYMKQIILISETARLVPTPVPSPINRLRLRRQFARCYALSR
ncbi:MAG TPA: zf-HC2 domain-containing protein [Nitrospira sp.]|nr:zf-HC2 domain-containing protein [Nitrospira sp.]